MRSKISAVVLAGGNGKRMGSDKARLRLDSKPALVELVRYLQTQFSEVVVAVGEDRDLGFSVGVPIVDDWFPGYGPLSGVHAGLSVISSPACLVVACDMPFLSPALLALLCRTAGKGEALACRIGGYIEPFPGIYPKVFLPLVEEALRQRELGVQAFLHRVPCRVLSEDVVRAVDPELRSFVNLNSPEDLTRWTR